MKLRAAVIGCGKIGSGFADDPLLGGDVFTHAEAYMRCSRTELVALCDADPNKAESCAQRWGVDAHFADAQEMLAAIAPEIVSICTPNETHFELARMAIDAPSVRAVLCEKPLAESLEQGRKLVDLARDRGTLLAVAYVRRHASNFKELQRLLKSGSIGSIKSIAGWYGKGMLHNATHWFDMLRMLESEIEWVEATNRIGEAGDDPSLDVTLGLASGCIATLRATDSRAYTIFEMDLLAERGRALIRDGGHSISLYRVGPSPRYSGYTELVLDRHDFGEQRNMMLSAIEDLVDALDGGFDPACGGEDGLEALRIVEAARKAAHLGRRISNSANLPTLGQ